MYGTIMENIWKTMRQSWEKKSASLGIIIGTFGTILRQSLEHDGKLWETYEKNATIMGTSCDNDGNNAKKHGKK